MRPVFWLLAGLSLGPAAWAADSLKPQAPSYSAASIVNAASNLPGSLAPNTIASIYGTGLSFVTRAVAPEDISRGTLPALLPGTGVSVLVGTIPASLYYVSPTQINFLVPSILRPGTTELQLVQEGRVGPAVKITLASAAPALFQADSTAVVACRTDGSVVTAGNPAKPGDVVVLYATGLGPTLPNPSYAEIAKTAAVIERMTDFRLTLDGTAVDSADVLYAGLAPGFAGLYQINLRLPQRLSPNPEVRVFVGEHGSPPNIRLNARPD